MKPFEVGYVLAEPFLPPLLAHVRRRLRAQSIARGGRVDILDVGGRKSHYTVGVPGRITVTDLPRRTDLQEQLNLGIHDDLMTELRRRRSNLEAVLYDDMTESRLPDASFDVVVAVEVLEHVEEDARFVEQVRRVLRPGGTFLMTTPNGDYVENRNPDHIRHYRADQLERLLSRSFEWAEVDYAIVGGPFRKLGLRSWSARRPMRTLLSMTGNVVNRLQSAPDSVRLRADGTHHLVAEARRLT